MRRIVHLTLGGITLGLAAIAAVELAFQVPDLAASPDPASPVTEIKAASLAGPDFDELAEAIRQRPLFTPGRRPLGPILPAPRTVEEGGQSGTMARLLGLMTQPGESQALFARDGQKPFTAKQGDQVDGWTVASIEADSVVLTGPLGERTMHPTEGARSPAGGASGQLPAAAPARPPAPLRLSNASRVMQPPATAAAPAGTAAASPAPVTRHPAAASPNGGPARQGTR
jgi:hypothetical protein